MQAEPEAAGEAARPAAPEENSSRAPDGPKQEGAFSFWGVASALADSVKKTTADISARSVQDLASFRVRDHRFQVLPVELRSVCMVVAASQLDSQRSCASRSTLVYPPQEQARTDCSQRSTYAPCSCLSRACMAPQDWMPAACPCFPQPL